MKGGHAGVALYSKVMIFFWNCKFFFTQIFLKWEFLCRHSKLLDHFFIIRTKFLNFEFILSQNMPYDVKYGINDPEFDNEARLITAEYTKFYLLCVYVPNSGRKLVNLKKRMKWDLKFQEYLVDLNKMKPVIICGDFNVAHQEIGKTFRNEIDEDPGFLLLMIRFHFEQIWRIRKRTRKVQVSPSKRGKV